jgi:4-diphosphocytidyl-2-C-methyl-D-erythritol kinase
VRRTAHAKANLALAVTSRRPDGFHTLRSVFVRLALHDDLEVSIGGAATADSLVMTSALERSPDENLVLEAAAALRATVPERELPGLAFTLRKRIPIAAGLAGGSTDAAAALELAAAAWGIELDPGVRLEVALRLGADVPFFASGLGAAVVEGIGETVRPLPAPAPPAGVLLVTPATRLATAEVFAAYDALPRSAPSADHVVTRLAAAIAGGLSGGELAALAPELRDANALWPAAVAVLPELADLRARLEATLDRPALLTGSGSTLVALYPSLAAAEDAAAAIEGSGPGSFGDARIIATRTHEEATP